MPTIGFSIPSTTDMTKEDLIDLIAKIMKELEWAFANLDNKNIKANSITSNEIKANAITTSELNAGAVTADKISVTELSAISANIGTVNAGNITAQTTINVGTDLKVGNNIYLNPTNPLGTIYLTPSIYMYADIPAGTLRIYAPNGVYANNIRIDVDPPPPAV